VGLTVALAIAANGCMGPFAPKQATTVKTAPAASSSGTKDSSGTKQSKQKSTTGTKSSKTAEKGSTDTAAANPTSTGGQAGQ